MSDPAEEWWLKPWTHEARLYGDPLEIVRAVQRHLGNEWHFLVDGTLRSGLLKCDDAHALAELQRRFPEPVAAAVRRPGRSGRRSA